jgi:hypothetical protein
MYIPIYLYHAGNLVASVGLAHKKETIGFIHQCLGRPKCPERIIPSDLLVLQQWMDYI